MKGLYISTIAILFLCMILFPLISMKKTVVPQVPSQSESYSVPIENDVFRVLITETGEIEIMDAATYIIGVVSAEMPAEYDDEALKAQAVAAYTFASYRRMTRSAEEYDVTDSYTTDQAFLSDQKARETWGDSYEGYTKKIKAAVESVKGQLLTYDGKPILATVHSISGGRTESAENVWGKEYPCLKAVESVGDVLSSGYLKETTVSKDEFTAAALKLGVTLSADETKWIGEIKRSESGYILSINICGTEIKGTDLRSELGLRSTNFDVEYTGDEFVFSVRGYGHGVGMSQNGAQFMALQGSKYDEILAWYYKGSVLKR